MADLVRTVDRDADVDAFEASGDEEGPVMARVRGQGLFSDLVSDDEDGAHHSWDFGASQHQAVSSTAAPVQAEGLSEKIQARLQARKEAKGEDEEEAEEEDEGAQEAKEDGKKKVTPKAKAKPQGTASHLNTGMEFADLRLSRPLLRAVKDLGFDTPTPIQRDVIPPALQGLDVLATAETGSGKTASFLLPILERLCQSPNVRSRRRDAAGRVLLGQVATKAMILIPTRELAVQCHAMLQDLAKYTMVTFQLVVGGFAQHDQATSLRRQPDVVVATPGRLLDHLLNSQSVHMELLEIVVFDEADRLLELGFREECMEVLNRCSRGRQTMLFSATLSTSVEDLAALALVKPVRVHANPLNKLAQTLEQEFVKAPSEELREAVLLSLVSRTYTSRVIVFCATRQGTHRLAILFGLCGLTFSEIHGNLTQVDRVSALQRFQDQEVDFLLATDLAARGLDLCNVDTVINFHLPLDVARYIHRVGRTARMGRGGRAVTIYTTEEYAKVKKLGRQCSGKMEAKVMKRSVAADSVRAWADKIAGFQEDISSILEDEHLEKELRLADMLASKSDNISKHKQDIRARPAKTWIMSNGMKQKLKEEDAERIRNAEAGTSKRKAEAEEEEAPSRKRRKGPETIADVEAKRKKKNRERILQKKQAERNERQQNDNMVRAAARRAKKSNRQGKVSSDAPEKKHKSKSKKKKGGGGGKAANKPKGGGGGAKGKKGGGRGKGKKGKRR